MDAIRHRFISQSLKLMNLVLVDVDHVRRGELGGNAFDRHLQLALGKQGKVIELVSVSDFNVTSFLETHHAREQVGNAADVDNWLTHRTLPGMLPDEGVAVGGGGGGTYSAISP